MDKSSFAGILIASGAIYLGLTLEGGKLGQILQPTAALIVFGGTLGAVMLQFPLRVVIAAFLRLGHVFFDQFKRSPAAHRRNRRIRPEGSQGRHRLPR